MEYRQIHIMSAPSPPRDLGNAPVRGQGFPESFLLCCMLILVLTYAFCKPALRTELGFLLGLFIHLGSVSHWEINLFADCSAVEWDKCLSQSEEQPRIVASANPGLLAKNGLIPYKGLRGLKRGL